MSLTEQFSSASESFAQEAFTINYTLAKNPELSSHEFKSVKTIGAVLEKQGIPVIYEFCHLPTAFKASVVKVDNPKGRLAILCEYDALPEVENKFVANVDFDVKKNSDNILSILIKYYKYAGGAHGYYENVAYNIDIRNGNFLTIDNLFKEGSDYKNIINEEIRNQIEELIKLDEQNKGVYEFKSIEDKQKFYIQDDNIVVYFDLYDIVPYAAGIPEFIINVNKIDHILKPEYKEIFK